MIPPDSRSQTVTVAPYFPAEYVQSFARLRLRRGRGDVRLAPGFASFMVVVLSLVVTVERVRRGDHRTRASTQKLRKLPAELGRGGPIAKAVSAQRARGLSQSS